MGKLLNVEIVRSIESVIFVDVRFLILDLDSNALINYEQCSGRLLLCGWYCREAVNGYRMYAGKSI